ncbi:MAG: hypothetical protein JO128_01220 [Alphaproteobacteria bacterium]|nr:hypothetical protein [Alphaproteobacteria bacterium]
MAKKRINYRFERAERERLQAQRRAQRDARREARRNEPAETDGTTDGSGPALAGVRSEGEDA